MLVDVKKYVLEDEKRISNLINQNKLDITLAVILANDLEASKSYVISKRKKAQKLGIKIVEYYFDKDVKEEDIISKIELLNNDKNITGILVQLPLYPHLNEDKIIEKIDYKKDVDGFTSYNLGKIYSGDGIIPCTPKGILFILNKLSIDLNGKNVVILGRSKIVGMPLASILIKKGATVTVCNSKTKDVSFYTKNADIVVVAISKPNFLNKDMVNENACIIDVGINKVDGKIVGDVDTTSLKDFVKYVTPVPGGVGITTVNSLMDNLVLMSLKEKK